MINIKTIENATGCKWIDDGKKPFVKGVSIDSRTIKPGEVFVAVKGGRFDGHKFIGKAIKRGARALIVSKKISAQKGINVFYVKDTTRALGDLAYYHRRDLEAMVVAITGSAGKTTTKEMVAAILKTKVNVLKNEKTLNNHYGAPLTLLKLQKRHKVVVLEVGTNQPGDIAYLARIAAPDVIIFTNIGESHLEKLKSKAGVFREKATIIKYMSKEGTIILNADDIFLRKILRKNISQKILTYGCVQRADYRACDINIVHSKNIMFKLRTNKFSLKGPSRENIYNALAAIACGRALKVPYDDIKMALNNISSLEGRQRIEKYGSFLVVDDAYNANPISFKSAISTFDVLDIKGKRILVCADMLELGGHAKSLHESVGKMILKSKIDVVISVGAYAKYIHAVVKKVKMKSSFHYENLTLAHKKLKEVLSNGDGILIKGSRAMHLEKTCLFVKTLTKKG